jgi:tRNA(Ile)-lysidine synthase
MSKIEGYFKSFVEEHELNHGIVACSGGVDSMVLLHLSAKFILETEVVHINYQLRGDDSDKDQLIVQQEAEKRGIKYSVHKVDLREKLEQEGGNLQETARKMRYQLLKTACLEKNGKVLFAHHADDQIETFFLNLARGGGMMGLSAMLPASDWKCRPLLPFSKAEIIEYAHQNGISWREDRSNEKLDYARNKLRNVLLPEMSLSYPSLGGDTLFLIEQFQRRIQLIKDELVTFLDEFESTSLLPFSIYDDWDEHHLMEFVREFDLSLGLRKELKKLRKSEKGKLINLKNPKFKAIFKEENGFYFSKVSNPQKLVIAKEECAELPSHFDLNCIYVDPDKIQGELTVRTWEIGDRMKPIGMKGSKLISDILKDAKIPANKKKDQLVVVDQEKIIWCVGFSICRDAIATSHSKIIKLTIEPSLNS